MDCVAATSKTLQSVTSQDSSAPPPLRHVVKQRQLLDMAIEINQLKFKIAELTDEKLKLQQKNSAAFPESNTIQNTIGRLNAEILSQTQEVEILQKKLKQAELRTGAYQIENKELKLMLESEKIERNEEEKKRRRFSEKFTAELQKNQQFQAQAGLERQNFLRRIEFLENEVRKLRAATRPALPVSAISSVGESSGSGSNVGGSNGGGLNCSGSNGGGRIEVKGIEYSDRILSIIQERDRLMGEIAIKNQSLTTTKIRAEELETELQRIGAEKILWHKKFSDLEQFSSARIAALQKQINSLKIQGAAASAGATPATPLQNSAPTNLAPSNLAPATLAPANFSPANLAPANLTPTNLAPANLAPANLAPANLAPADPAMHTKFEMARLMNENGRLMRKVESLEQKLQDANQKTNEFS